MTLPVSSVGAVGAKVSGHAAMLEMQFNKPLQLTLFPGQGGGSASIGSDMRANLASATDTISNFMMKADPRGDALMAARERLSAAPVTFENYKQSALIDIELMRHSAKGQTVFSMSLSLTMSVMESIKSLLHAPN